MNSFKSSLIADLHHRGLIKDCSNLEELDQILSSDQKIAVYAGFDPTALSLHVGHLTTLTVLNKFAQHGHTVLPVIGTGTAMIGDPTGKTKARQVLLPHDIDKNAKGLEESIRLVLGNGSNIIKNGEWINSAGLVWFLREIGSRIPMSKLLSQETIKSRLGDEGISFLETCYPLLQAWDFWHLSKTHPVIVQIGGSDQFGNICMGLELIGRSGEKQKVFGLTHPLLVSSNGEKMGKTSGGAIWLNSSMLDSFDFFQFWRTLRDEDTAKIARMLSDIPETLIQKAEKGGGTLLECLKAELAKSMTQAIRGEKAAQEAENASLGKGRVAEGLPTIEIDQDEATDLIAIMIKLKLCKSKGEVRRLIQAGGLRVNGKKHSNSSLTSDNFINGVVVLSAGKTQHRAVRILPEPGPSIPGL